MPSARLGSLYGLYFAVVALSIGWFGPFFQSLGFTAIEIGVAIGVLTGSKIFAPYLWGTLGDLLPNRLRVVQIGIIGSTLAAGLLLIEVDFFGLCLVLALFGIFWNAIIAQFDTLTPSIWVRIIPLFIDTRLGFDRLYFDDVGVIGFFRRRLRLSAQLIIGGLFPVIISMTLPAHGRIHPNASKEVKFEAV